MAARSDDFNRANGALGTPSDGGSAWNSGSNAVVSGNQCVDDLFSASNGQASSLEASNADVEVQLTLKALWNAPCGPAVRVSAADHFIALDCQDAGAGGNAAPRIYSYDGATRTNLATCSGTCAVDDVMKLVASGTTITAYKNGSQIGQATGITYNQTVTKHGFVFSTGVASRGAIDDFSIADAGGGGGGSQDTPELRGRHQMAQLLAQ